MLALAIWLPILRTFHVAKIKISDSAVQPARYTPNDQVFDQVKDFRLLGEYRQSRDQVLHDASMLLQGKLKAQGCDTTIHLPFSASDLDRLAGDCALFFAGFYVPDVFLQAYQSSGRNEFLLASEGFILGAAAYEKSAWIPKGMFWNDHALAARMIVLANFWRFYRRSPEYSDQVAHEVLELAARTEQRLADPRQFTFATNHGVMQNLGLLHGALCFPTLPGSQALAKLAQERLNDQSGFYVSEEGWVLEHSSEYQGFGIGLLARAFRYLTLLNQPIPADWLAKYQQSIKVYTEIRRPDGSLPVFGDTDLVQEAPLVATLDAAGEANAVIAGEGWLTPLSSGRYPVSGYSIWWDGLTSWPKSEQLSQTAFTWSDYSGHGHKHADELSMAIWAGGRNWISNVGYWPYGSEEREAAVSWEGSNAPHLAGEAFGSTRRSRLLGEAGAEKLRAIDLERLAPAGSILRRQAIQYGVGSWVVLDSSSGGPEQRMRTLWTTGPDVLWQTLSQPGTYRLAAAPGTGYMNASFISSGQQVRQLLRGSRHPFAGWQVKNSTPVPAFALTLEQPVNSWSAAIWVWGSGVTEAPSYRTSLPAMSFSSATEWKLQFPNGSRKAELARHGNRISVSSAGGEQIAIELETPRPVISEQAQLQAAFAQTARRYPISPSDTPRRRKATYLVGAAFLTQQLVFMTYKAFRGARGDFLPCLSAAAWLVGGIWLVGFRL